ncbi:hypothetical protein XO10_03460 [Marinitoga sp. 1135]|uniref:Uncharacterized protein n=2 Tax=Marinitoga TaxID=160798 RepID=H2J659_MARPK|nr:MULTISPECIES: hypothetical protein [unclassified Marinitoga]AEX85120.1 hypothetical protein Marpi_0682 [Marinitoga piezophila KA3]APT75622.1 hypothetical protein LN42_03860 [Marinitoga sp. 1137]NUU95332.1 hypothetical protein [Marinitoga sp. 1135]NUU97266.1 hypothetical protein [Marinitoga sp. 1138]
MFFDDFEIFDDFDDFEEVFDKMQHTEVCPPCVQCGYCCKHTPCFYGEWDEEKQQCKFLTEDNKCSKYDEIVKYEESINAEVRMFGSGCCLNYLNPDRIAKIRKINNHKSE